jgi:pyruvate kinase
MACRCALYSSHRHLLRFSPRRASSTLLVAASLDPSISYASDRRTKIVATLGPSVAQVLPDAISAGANVFRINCAHGEKAQYARNVELVRSACSAAAEKAVDEHAASVAGNVAIAFDIKGPEIRTGRFSSSVPQTTVRTVNATDGTVSVTKGNREIPLHRGDFITLTTDPSFADAGTRDKLYVALPEDLATLKLRPGQKIFVDDGQVELSVLEVDAGHRTLRCVSNTTAPLGERKGVNLPGIAVDLPSITAKDERDIVTARDLGADIIFASFVRSAGGCEGFDASLSFIAVTPLPPLRGRDGPYDPRCRRAIHENH